MQTSWVLIANSAEAKLYEQQSAEVLSLIQELHHDESRAKGKDLASDGPGHNQGKGNGQGAYVEETSPKDFEAQRFATELAKFLDKGRSENKFSSLVIASAPRFHGMLNQNLNKHVSEMVKKHIEKDLSQVAEHELAGRLKELM